MKIPQEIIDKFKLPPCAFLSGSRGMGYPTDASDWDICVPFLLSVNIKEICSDYETSEYFEGFVHKFGDYKINFIPLHPLDMLCWCLATKTIRDIHKYTGWTRLTNKEIRHGLFETYRGVIKASINYEDGDAALGQVENILKDNGLG